jgi:CheY-like chemotaxis protein
MSDFLILLVEDSPVIRLVVQKQLAQLGHSCKTVATGEEALSESSSNEIALIFMDIGLPGVDGIETTMLIRKREQTEPRKHVPIIALTAHSNKDRCLLAGMDDFLQKPVFLEDLKQMLDKWSVR